MFGRVRESGPELADLDRVETAVRTRFGLAEADLVLVRQEVGRPPDDVAPRTTVLFWKAGARYRVRVFRQVAEVSGDDLPPGWLLGALRDEGEADCC